MGRRLAARGGLCKVKERCVLMPTNLIAPQELRKALASDHAPVVLDVRWRLDKPEGRDDFAAGHVPGACYVSLDEELSDLSRQGLGRHPLPAPGRVESLLRRVGWSAGREIVVYDDWNRAGSARAWWVLTASGIERVRILDGGYSGWVEAGGEVEDSAPGAVGSAVGGGELVELYSAAQRPVLDQAQAADLGRGGVLLDARHRERFAGVKNPAGEVPGHIPGAASLAGTSLLDDCGYFKSPAELEELFDSVGATAEVAGASSVGAYCGSGITACVVIAAAASIGREVALFPGSWSQWSADSTLPVER